MTVRLGIILAGGRGERMAAGRNKALLNLAGRPMLLHAVDAFRACCDRIVVVSAAADLPAIAELLPRVELVAGGDTRHGSEWNALQTVQALLHGDEIIAIHDAARPLVLALDIAAVFREAARFGAALLAEMASRPALVLAADHIARAYPATDIWRAQTPQAARAAVLLDSYRRAAAEGFIGTDTAEVLARYGYAVRVVPAGGANPKVTVPADLPAAEAILQARLLGET